MSSAHILNVYEDLTLKLSQIFDLIDEISAGTLKNVQEKIDGQNVTFTVDETGKLLFFTKGASHESFVRGTGADREELARKYAGNALLAESMISTYDVIQECICSHPNATQFFSEGKIFIEAAAVSPDCRNFIPYTRAAVVLIGTDGDLEVYEQIKESAIQLSSLGTRPIIEVPILFIEKARTTKFASIKAKFYDLIRKQKIPLNGTVETLCVSLVSDFLRAKNLPKADLAAARLVRNEKRLLTKTMMKLSDWQRFQEFENDRSLILSEALLPFEKIVQSLGIAAFEQIQFKLGTTDDVVVASLQYSIAQMRNAFVSGKIQADSKQKRQIASALTRLGENGEVKFTKAVEGIVFVFQSHKLKLTGMFGPLNRLNSLFVYGKSPVRIIS